jgi:hypothetical protein
MEEHTKHKITLLSAPFAMTSIDQSETAKECAGVGVYSLTGSVVTLNVSRVCGPKTMPLQIGYHYHVCGKTYGQADNKGMFRRLRFQGA